MEANTYELGKLLQAERRYVIPTYQRDYEWTEDGQWKLLFDDLENTATRLGDARADAGQTGKDLAKADQSVAPHFLGAVVLDQVPVAAGAIDVRAVIDGQQRLTTMQLLLRGLLDALLELKSPRCRQLRRMLRNPDDVAEIEEERHKLWPRRRDRKSWQETMVDTMPVPTHRYHEARAYFGGRAREFLAAEDSAVQTRESQAELLFAAVTSLFKMVVIDLEGNDDAQVIFEVLNGRQTPLTATDLVKNLLFLRAEASNEKELDDLYDRFWARFDDDWWKDEVGTGHAARRRSDFLISHWLTAALGVEANVAHLYGEVRGHIEAGDRSIASILKDIAAWGDAFRGIHSGVVTSNRRETQALERLVTMQITTAMPLLLWLYTRPNQTMGPETRRKAVIAIESWVVRRFLAGGNTRGYGRAFVEVLRAGKRALDQGANVANAITEALNEAPNGRHWPDDAELRQTLLVRNSYNGMNRWRLRTVLGAIDEEMRRSSGFTEPAEFDYHGLTIEHIMPQSWQEHWPVLVADENNRPAAEQRRAGAVNTLGNLTLVTQSLNPSLSNAAWALKREALAEHSALRLNAELVSKDGWDEDAIEARGSEMAELISHIWPHPGPGSTTSAEPGSEEPPAAAPPPSG